VQIGAYRAGPIAVLYLDAQLGDFDMRVGHYVWLVGIVALVVMLSGCSRPLKSQVEGKWRHTSGAMTLEFLKDGSFTGNAGPVPLSGTFTTPDEQHLKLEGAGMAGSLLGPMVYQATVKEDSLSLAAGVVRQEFKRSPD
jgi:hypothetical protein